MYSCRKRFFSLVEVTVVIAIAAILCSVAAVRMRDGSPGSKFEKNVQSFREFLLRSRNIAREEGRNIGVFFDPERRKCFAAPQKAPSIEREDDSMWVNSPAPPRYILEDFAGDALRNKYGITADDNGEEKLSEWQLPEGCNITVEQGHKEEDKEAELLLFTCFAGGRVSGQEVTFSCGAFSTLFTCTALTGTLVINSGDKE